MNGKLVLMVLGVLIGLVAILLAMYLFFGKPHELVNAKTIEIRNTVFQIEVAATNIARMRGLSGRDSLDEKKGLLFLFDEAVNYGFWMRGMKFAIDIIWISNDRIVGFSENAKPEPDKNILSLTMYYPPKPVDKVLEVNAGIVDQYGFQIGDRVVIE